MFHSKATRVEIEKNTFSGRSPWLMTVYTDDGGMQTSWHRSIGGAMDWAKGVFGFDSGRIEVK